MINLDSITNENNKEHNKKRPYIFQIILGGSGSGKTNALLNLIKEQDDIDKIYLYARDLREPMYEFWSKCAKMLEQNISMIQMHLFECSNTMDDVYENIDDYNPNRQRKILIVFHDMVADIMTNKKFQAITKELFIRCRKLNISLAFITQCYFSVPKDVRLNLTYYLIMKINNKRELQNIAINHSADVDYQRFCEDLQRMYKRTIFFLTIDTTLPASNPLRSRKNLLMPL